MGAYLSEPITEKDTEQGSGNELRFAVSGMQGWRSEMEVRVALSLASYDMQYLAPHTHCILRGHKIPCFINGFSAISSSSLKPLLDIFANDGTIACGTIFTRECLSPVLIS
jgi:hypothetical protein